MKESGLLIPPAGAGGSDKVDLTPYAWQDDLVVCAQHMWPTDGIMIVQPPGSGKTRGIAKLFHELIAAPVIRYGYPDGDENAPPTYYRQDDWWGQTLIVAEPFRALARQVANELHETLMDDDAWLLFNIKRHAYLHPRKKDSPAEVEADKKKAVDWISKALAYFSLRAVSGEQTDRYEQVLAFAKEHEITPASGLNSGEPVREPRFFMEVQEGVVSTHVVPFKPLVVGTYENISAMFNNLEASVSFGKEGDESNSDNTEENSGVQPGHRVRAVIIDEFHNISKDRGIFIDNIIHAAAAHNAKYPMFPIAVVLLSGTVTPALKQAIVDVYDRSFRFTRLGGMLIKEGKRPYAVVQAPLRQRSVLLATGQDRSGNHRFFNLAGYFELIRRWRDIPPGELAVMFAPTKSIAEALAIVAYAYLDQQRAPKLNQGSAELYSPRLVSTSNVYNDVAVLARLALGLRIDMEDAIGNSDHWLDYGIYLDHANSNDQATRESFQSGHSLLNVRFLIATTTIAEGFNILRARALALDYEGEDDGGNYTTVEPFFWDSAKYGQMLGRIGRYQPGVLFSGHTIEQLEARVMIDNGPVRPEMSFQQKLDFVWSLVWNAAVDKVDFIDYNDAVETFWRKNNLGEVLDVMIDLDLISDENRDPNKSVVEALSAGELQSGLVTKMVRNFMVHKLEAVSLKMPPISFRGMLLVAHSFMRVSRWYEPVMRVMLSVSDKKRLQLERLDLGDIIEAARGVIREEDWDFVRRIAIPWVNANYIHMGKVHLELKGEWPWDRIEQRWRLDVEMPPQVVFGWLISGQSLPDTVKFNYLEFSLAGNSTSIATAAFGPLEYETPDAPIFDLIAGPDNFELEKSGGHKVTRDDVFEAYAFFPRWLASRMVYGAETETSLFSISMAEVASRAEVARTLVKVFPLTASSTASMWDMAFTELVRTYELMRLARYSYQHGWTTDTRILENFLRHQRSRWARIIGSERGDLPAKKLADLVGAIVDMKPVWAQNDANHRYSAVTISVFISGHDTLHIDLDKADLRDLRPLLTGASSIVMKYNKFRKDDVEHEPVPLEEFLPFLAEARGRLIPTNFINSVGFTGPNGVPLERVQLAVLPHQEWLRQLSTIIAVE